MTLVAAAVCPHPPLLVPGVGGGTDDLADLRNRCAAAVESLYAADPAHVFVVGADVGLRATSLAPWGADVTVDVPEPLPLPLLVGGWLTRGRRRSFVAVDAGLDPDDCAALGRDLATAADRVALLVMGDGSARRTEKAPGYVDPRAAGYDDAVHAALATADTATLLALEPDLADQLLAAGRPAWQVLAGAAGSAGLAPAAATVEAPLGVGYHLAVWR